MSDSVPRKPPVGNPSQLALAEALVNGTDEAMILVTSEGFHAVRDGHPLSEELGVRLEQVLDDPEAYISSDDVRTLADMWSAVASAPGNVQQGSFTIRDAGGNAVQVDGTASNLEHTEIDRKSVV